MPTDKFAEARMQNDGSIAADGKFLKLKGIAFPVRNKICGEPNTVRWACGMRAHGAARTWMAHIEETTAAAESNRLTHDAAPASRS